MNMITIIEYSLISQESGLGFFTIFFYICFYITRYDHNDNDLRYMIEVFLGS